MCTTSIHLDRLVLGRNQFGGEFIAPAHRKYVTSSLSSHFLNQKGGCFSQNQKIPFRLDIAKPSLVLNGKKVSLGGGDAEEVERITQYYQHVGLLPEKGIAPKDAALRKRASKVAVRAMHKASIPGTSGQVLAGASIAEDTLSTARNVLCLIPGAGPGSSFVNHLGYYAGMFWGFFALREVDGGVKDLKRAEEIGDREGRTRAQARLASGTIVSAASIVYLTGRVCDSLELATVATGALEAAGGLFAIGTALSSALSYLGWTRCHTFNERLNEYLENRQLSEVQRLQGALRFLKGKISATPEEIDEIKANIEKEHPGLGVSEKEELLKQALTHLAERKVKYLKRRTSNKSLVLIQNQLDSILAKLADEKKRPEGIKEAALLIHKIQNENRIKMGLFVLRLIASLISLAAFLMITFATLGIAPFILYGVAGAIFLGMRIYTSAGLFMKKGPKVDTASNPDGVALESLQVTN